jgi:hypothetical protein
MKITDTFYWQSKRFRIVMIHLCRELYKAFYIDKIAIWLNKKL